MSSFKKEDCAVAEGEEIMTWLPSERERVNFSHSSIAILSTFSAERYSGVFELHGDVNVTDKNERFPMAGAD